MAKSSALKKLQSQKSKSAPKKFKKEKKGSTVAKKSKDKAKTKTEEVPTQDEIMSMKMADLEFAHTRLPEELDGWADMNRSEKREALVEVLWEVAGKSPEATDIDVELEEEPEETEEKVVPIKTDKKTAKKGKTKATKIAPKKKLKNSDDILANAVNEIENMTEEESDEEAHNLKDDIEYNYFRLGGVLSNLKVNNYIGEYDNFREKVEAEFGMKYRKAEYLIKIYDNIIESGIEWTSLKDIGWTKLSIISGLLTPENMDEWLEKASEMNSATLRQEVKAMNAAAKSGTSVSKQAKSSITRLTFQVHEDQRENIETAIKQAKEALSTEHNTPALEAICMEYLSGGGTKTVTKEQTVNQFFKSLVKKADGDIESALGTLLEGPEFEKVFGIAINDIDFEDEED